MARPSNPRISIVVPVFNEEDNLRVISKRLEEVLKEDSDFEIIFVDDGSTDGTLLALKELNSSDRGINYISLSRNFGHQSALKAGIDQASGDCVISMDADLQHPPELIPSMIEKWKEGCDIVYTVRKDRARGLYPFSARVFYRLINLIAEIKLPPGSADFRLLDRSAADVLRSLHEPSPFLRGLVPWIGFKQHPIEYEPRDRFSGRSKYSFGMMRKLAISGITSFSAKPLQISTYLGLIISFLSFLYALYAIYMRLFTNKTISGWASVLVSVLLVGGIQLLMLGIIGQYLGQLFLESKRRPSYIIAETSLDTK